MSGTTHRYGILMPHFGEYASRERIIESARTAERYGFDSVWVRDHLSFRTHEWESQDRTFIDPFVVLSAIAGTTDRIMLATAALVPHRHPIHAALLLASLDRMAGPNRIIAGWSVGAYDAEFDAVGMKGWDRREVIEEYVGILRKLWTGQEITHRGKYYQFDNIDIHPTPAPGSIQVWYAGTSPASVRRAVAYCDGWGTTAHPVAEYRSRVKRLIRFAEEANKPVPVAGVSAWVSPGRTVEEGVSKIDLPRFLELASKQANGEGTFQTLADLDGMVIAGPAEVIVETVRRYEAAGAQHFVFDLRNRFAEWDELLPFFGEEVLPLLRRA